MGSSPTFGTNRNSLRGEFFDSWDAAQSAAEVRSIRRNARARVCKDLRISLERRSEYVYQAAEMGPKTDQTCKYPPTKPGYAV